MLSRLALTLFIFNVSIATTGQAQEITVTFSHFLGPKSFFQTDVAEPFAAELAAKTGGRVKVQAVAVREA